MSEKDKELVQRAKTTIWEDLEPLIEEAESDEAKAEIRRMLMRQYRRENGDF